MAAFLTSYSLQANPYEVRELNPLSAADDANLFVKVAGCERLDEVDDVLKTAASDAKPAFILVKGVSKCGLTSVSNYILARFCEQRGINTKRFVVPESTTGHNDGFHIWLYWLSALADMLDEKQLVDKALLKEFRGALNTVATDRLSVAFRPLMRRLANGMYNSSPPAGYGVCLEFKDVTTPDILREGFAFLASAQTVCVFTVGDYEPQRKEVIPYFEAYKGVQKLTLHLRALSSVEVEILLKERWRKTSKGIPDPFEDGALQRAFRNREQPARRVLGLINQLLVFKSQDFPLPKRWPDDRELGFRADELVNKIAAIEVPV